MMRPLWINKRGIAYRTFIIGYIRVLAVLCPLLLPAAQAPGQSLDYGAYEALFEEPVTTSVTGSPQRASDAPATMEIITADDIRRSGAGDIPGVLRHVTGLNVFRWTNNGADVSVRGYNSAFTSRLLVMINGRQVYADHYGYVPWSTLPVTLGEIRQIEVVKGPNSALFGFNAVGGVINIITFDPDFDDVDFVTVRGGTQNTVEGTAASTFSLGEKTRIRLSAGSRRNDDFDTPLRPLDRGKRRGDERETINLEGHFSVADNMEFTLESSYAHVDQTDMAPNYQLTYQEEETRSIRVRFRADTAYGLIEAGAYRNRIGTDVFVSGSSGVNYDFAGRLVRLHNEVKVFNIQDIFKAGAAHTLRLSAEYRQSNVNTSPITGAEISYDVSSASAMWNWQISQALSLTVAARHDRLDLQREGIIPAGLFLTNAYWDRGLDETSYNSGLVWDVNENDTLRLTAAKGAQLPSLYGLGGSLFGIKVPPQFIPTGVLYVTGVPTLVPTTVENYELAWDRRFPVTGMHLKTSLFVGETRDAIASVGDSDLAAGIASAPANLGNSNMDGIEVSLDGTFGNDWRWGLGYVHERIDDDFGARYTPDATLVSFERTTPRHVVTANLGRTRGGWTVDGYLRYESKVLGFRSPEDFLNPQMVLFPVPHFVTVDARLGYRVNDGITVELSGQNLLHDEQVQHGGPAVERKVYLGVVVEF